MFRVYQRFESLGDPMTMTFTEWDAAKEYANELRREIAALPLVCNADEESSDSEWNRLVWAAHDAPERVRGIIVAHAAVVVEEVE